jgi:hypothetical protein
MLHFPKCIFPSSDDSKPPTQNFGWKSVFDYFKTFNIQSGMWVTAATMHFEGNSAKWLQVYKQSHKQDSCLLCFSSGTQVWQ